MTNTFKNHKPYRAMPKVELDIHKICDICKHPIVELGNFDTHKDICEYLYFRDTRAAELGLRQLAKYSEGYYIRVLLDMMGIEYHAYKISGIGGHGVEIFVKEDLATLIDLYFLKEGFAGMTLEEYIRVVTDAKS